MTPDGHRKLHEELKRLKSIDRPKNIADIETARGHGDLSENAEYEAAKEKQLFISRRIGEVENQLARAQVIDPATLSHKKIVFGATIRLVDADSGEELQYQIVGAHETDVRIGKISIDSPIAKSLIGKEQDDVVKVVTPRGAREFQILEIKYQ
ncbi:MAG: transcription elongation factor GreA [Deltaproteobacteria bacterium]|nr:transcription elongation factor GreA [Deltaproteobacteria bacterium]